MRMTTILAAALLAAAPAAGQEPAAGARPGAVQPTPDVILGVDGLACPFCAYGLEKKLKALDGVAGIEVKLDDGEVLIFLEDGAQVSDDALDRAVEDAGFTIRSIERPGGEGRGAAGPAARAPDGAGRVADTPIFGGPPLPSSG